MPNPRVLYLVVMLNSKYFSMANPDSRNLGMINMLNLINKQKKKRIIEQFSF